MEEFSSNSSLSHKSVHPIAVISQLLQNVASIHHIDDLLEWIANAMLQQLGMVAVQVWAVQAYTGGVLRRKLRASAGQEPSLSTEIVDSTEIGILIDRMLREQHGMLSIPVIKALSQQRANHFVQHNCRYWTVYFLQKDILLPPVRGNAYAEEVATPLQMAFSFFTSEPLQDSQTRAINFLIEQSLRIAMSKSLFSPMPARPGRSEIITEPLIATLVPERTLVTGGEHAENAAHIAAMMPSDKRDRQIYNLIDDKKNVADLMTLARANQKEILGILQNLVLHGYIILRDSGGSPVDITSLT